MSFIIKESYNLDILNFMNVITGVEFYIKPHQEAYNMFKNAISPTSKEHIRILKEHSRGMLSPFLTLVISAVDDFDSLNIKNLLENEELLENCFSKYSYYDKTQWDLRKKMFKPISLIIEELETAGFKNYWFKERLPIIINKRGELNDYLTGYNLGQEISNMLGMEKEQDDIILYLCSFAAPHGIKICNSCYISDTSYSNESTLRIAIHEMFHPPYDKNNLEKELAALANDSLIKKAFENQNPQYGYSEIQGFIEENVVEAMELFISHKKGLILDPIDYLENHDGGSHVFSFILLIYFKDYPKPQNISFENYFISILKCMPIGALEYEYDKLRQI